MAHAEKFKACDVRRVMKEYYRELEHYKNNVDVSKIGLNYCIECNADNELHHYYNRRSGPAAHSFEYRYSKIEHSNRKDAVGMVDWVVTLPEELKNASEEKQKEFFYYVYGNTVLRYGMNNVLPGIVHNDETTPHIHIPVIPVVKEKDSQRVCAKKFLNRNELRDYQVNLDYVIEKIYGFKNAILNGRTKGNYSLEELKERTKKETQLHELEETINQRAEQLLIREQMISDRELELEKEKEELEEQKRFFEEQNKFLEQKIEIAEEEIIKIRNVTEREKCAARLQRAMSNGSAYSDEAAKRRSDGYSR